jgi:hypothetical protein
MLTVQCSYAVSEVWYRKTNDYKNILKCYLNHPVRKVPFKYIFIYIYIYMILKSK